MNLQLFQDRVTKKDIGDLFQKISMLLEAGYNPCQAISLLAQESERKSVDKSGRGVRAAAKLLLPSMLEGNALSYAMSLYPKYFGQYITQVEVGETTGKIDEVAARISEQIKNEGRLMGKLRSAMVYPVIVLTLALGAAFYLYTTIIPEMIGMLKEVGVTEMPAITMAVYALGNWAKKNGLLMLGIIGAIIIALLIANKTPKGKLAISKFIAHFPLIGKAIQNNSLAMFFSNWQQMALAGAEMSDSLNSAVNSIPNHYIRREMDYVYESYVRNGAPVYQILYDIKLVKDMEVQSVQVGVETGKVSKILGIIAEDRVYEAERSIAAITAAINPIIMVIVGIIVGTLVFSVYAPIISVSSAL